MSSVITFVGCRRAGVVFDGSRRLYLVSIWEMGRLTSEVYDDSLVEARRDDPYSSSSRA